MLFDPCEIDKVEWAVRWAGALIKENERAPVDLPTPPATTEGRLAAVLTEKLGGGPEMLFDNNPDHYHIVTDMLPFMLLAGPAWEAVAERVLAHQKARRAKKNT